MRISKEAMRRSRITRHETLGKAALSSFSVAVPDEIYTLPQKGEMQTGAASLLAFRGLPQSLHRELPEEMDRFGSFSVGVSTWKPPLGPPVQLWF